MSAGSRKGGNTAGPADVAVDTVAGADYQQVKLVNGVIGQTTGVELPTSLDADGGLKTHISNTAVPVTLDAAALAALESVTVGGTVAVSNLPATQPVSAAALPLPSGASTSALQGGGLPAALGSGGGVKVDGSGTALPVSAASLPLPSGAATSALQAGGLPAALGSGGGLKVDGSGTALPVSGTVAVTGVATAVNQTTMIAALPASLGAKTGAASLSVVPNTDTAFQVVGNVASAATDSGNPVKAGGVFNTTMPTLTNGQRGDLQLGAHANASHTSLLAILPYAKGGASRVDPFNNMLNNNVDAITGENYLAAALGLLNGSSTYDRARNNVEATLLASAVRAVTTNSPDQTNYNGRGVALSLNVTVEAATETLSVTIQGKDSVSSAYYDIVAFGVVYNATTMAPGCFGAIMAPGLIVADSISADSYLKSGLLPRTWRAVITHSSSGNWTYSLGAATIL